MSVLARTFVQEIVSTDRLGVRVGENGKRDVGFPEVLARNIRGVNADRDGTYSDGFDLGQILLNAPQLGVAEGSPVTPIKNEQDALRRPAVDRCRKQLRQSDGISVAVGQPKLRRLMSHHWRTF